MPTYPLPFPAKAPAREKLQLNNRQAAMESPHTLAIQVVNTNGGASLRVRVGGSSVFCSSNSAVTNRDISISFQHNPGLAHTNNVQMLNREPDPGSPNYAAGIGGVMRFFTDGSFAPGYTGRFYAAVCTNRTDPEDIRFRIHRQLAQQIGVKFAA